MDRMDPIIFYVGYILGKMSEMADLSPLDEKMEKYLVDYANNKGLEILTKEERKK